MKYFSLFLMFLILSCKSDPDKTNSEKRSPLKSHNPFTEISQDIENETAISFYLEGLDKYQKMEYDSAIVYFESSLRFEQNPITYNELGTTSATQRKYEQAIKYFKKGRETDPTYWPNYVNESRTYLTLLEFDKGKNILYKMIQNCDSDYWVSYANFYLALMYYNDGLDCAKVKELLDKSISLRNDSDLRSQYDNFYEKYANNCG